MDRKYSAQTSGWKLAVKLLKKYLVNPTKADVLLNDFLPEIISFTDRKFCQFLFFGSIRYKGLLDYMIGRLLMKGPRNGLRALLMVGMYEILMSCDGDVPKIVDYAVGVAKGELSLKEAGLVNAVLRKVWDLWEEIKEGEGWDLGEWLSVRYSHPLWLVRLWIREFGEEDTRKLLEWDQEVSPVYVRIMEGFEDEDEGLEGCGVEGFYRVGEGKWNRVKEWVDEGRIYIQDPSTGAAPRLAGVQAGDRVLDLCAAPGGKSMILAGELRGGLGQLVALDLPGERIGRLRENLSKLKDVNYAIVEADLNTVDSGYLERLGLPGEYDVVLVDVPCSNTGVLRRRVDAKWRLREGDIEGMARVQLELLRKAGGLVKEGGRLVYSTCSIENEENFGVVEAFLEGDNGFELMEGDVRYPWVSGYDGGGAFLMRRGER